MGHNIVKQKLSPVREDKVTDRKLWVLSYKEIVVNLGIVLYPSHTVSSIENRNISPKEIKMLKSLTHLNIEDKREGQVNTSTSNV